MFFFFFYFFFGGEVVVFNLWNSLFIKFCIIQDSFGNVVLITLFKYCGNIYMWKYVLCCLNNENCCLNNTTKQILKFLNNYLRKKILTKSIYTILQSINLQIDNYCNCLSNLVCLVAPQPPLYLLPLESDTNLLIITQLLSKYEIMCSSHMVFSQTHLFPTH